MDKDFWLARWSREEIGFHQNSISPYLLRYWQELGILAGSEVLVPLCGKSLDMLWLREQGYHVLGVELSELAVKAFFKENNLVPHVANYGRFVCYACERLRILCGDFFDLEAADLDQISAVFDRASLVALPSAMRENYVHHLMNLLPASAKTLLVTMDYAQHSMAGPPFAVPAAEVERLYSEYAQVQLLTKQDVLSENTKFQARGVTRLHELIFILSPRIS